MFNDKKSLGSDKTDKVDTTGGILMALGVIKAWELASNAVDVFSNEFERIAYTHFPETEAEWALAKTDISQKNYAIGLFNRCEKEYRKDCVSIYLAASEKDYLDKAATTDELIFIEKYGNETKLSS